EDSERDEHAEQAGDSPRHDNRDGRRSDGRRVGLDRLDCSGDATAGVAHATADGQHVALHARTGMHHDVTIESDNVADHLAVHLCVALEHHNVALVTLGGAECVGADAGYAVVHGEASVADRKSTRLNSSHVKISYAVFCLKKKNI